MHKLSDFLIAGGGPAGATAGALLASRGERVTLVERSTALEHKVCGEFLSYETLAYMKDLGLNVWQLGAAPIRKLRLAENHLIAEITLPFEAASLSRKTMDAALLQHARECGAQIVAGQVERLERDASGWRMHLNDRTELRGSQAMLATGKHDLRGHARGNGSQPGLVAFKMHLKLSAEQTRQLNETVDVVLFPGGYLGMQPTEDGNANLCMLLRSDALRKIGGSWPAVFEYLKTSSRFLRERLFAAQECSSRPLALSHIPYGYIRRDTAPGLWALGDQTAVIPSFSGDGMAIALHSAHCAVACHASQKDATEYNRQMRQCHQSQVTWTTRLSRLMVEAPKLASLLRYCPSLLQRLATSTRIAEDQLFTPSLKPRGVS
jgi:flavin-dependent dehydrogenase